MKYIVFVLVLCKFASDILYEKAYLANTQKKVYESVKYIEAASVINPASILIAQGERVIFPFATPGKRMLFFHPNDFDALIVNVDENRQLDNTYLARQYLFRAAKADPFSSMNNVEMKSLLH